MTEQVFLNLHTQPGGINTTGTINVNIDLSPGGLTGTVTGITVTNVPQLNPPNVSAFPDLVRVLEEVTDVKFRVGTVLYSLSIQERRAYPMVDPNLSFFYFKVTPFEFPYNSNTVQSQDVSVSLYPFLLGSKFTFSDYNPIIDNVIEQRRTPSGSRIVESDRNSITVSPSNLNAILSGSAKLAAIQESNYSSTGWSNGRYEGSKTTSKNYGGIPPVLSGVTFTGAVYAPQTLDSYIVSQSYSTRTIQDIFHTGKNQTPTYEIITSSFNTTAFLDISGSTVIVAQTGSRISTGSFDINTLIKIDQEKMRVVDYVESNGGTYLQVVRGLFNTTQTSHSGTSIVYIVAPTFIYSYDTSLRRETAISNAKIWVEETENVYYTDSFGGVYTGSIGNT